MNSRYTLPTAHGPPRGPDWGRVYRWSLLGTIIMLVWLLYPTATCTWQAFRDIPLSEDSGSADGIEASDVDQERVRAGAGFFDRLWTSADQCYADTPLTGQGVWKTRVFVLLVFVTAGSWLLALIVRTRRRRQQREAV